VPEAPTPVQRQVSPAAPREQAEQTVAWARGSQAAPAGPQASVETPPSAAPLDDLAGGIGVAWSSKPPPSSASLASSAPRSTPASLAAGLACALPASPAGASPELQE
jgi:hypothetical protein